MMRVQRGFVFNIAWNLWGLNFKKKKKLRTCAADTNANGYGNQKIVTETSVQNLLTVRDKLLLHTSTWSRSTSSTSKQ